MLLNILSYLLIGPLGAANCVCRAWATSISTDEGDNLYRRLFCFFSHTTSPGQSETKLRIQITVRLGEYLGFVSDTEGYVKKIIPGGQLDTIGGINVGDRIVEAGGTSLGTAELGTTTWMDQVISIIQEKTNRGEKSLELTFEQVRAPLLSVIRCLVCL